MSQLLIKNPNVILPDRILENHSVLCDKGKIVQIGPAEDFPEEATATVSDASGKYLAPGLIDLHTHGLPPGKYTCFGNREIEFAYQGGPAEDKFEAQTGQGYVFSRFVKHGTIALEETEYVEVFVPVREEHKDF